MVDANVNDASSHNNGEIMGISNRMNENPSKKWCNSQNMKWKAEKAITFVKIVVGVIFSTHGQLKKLDFDTGTAETTPFWHSDSWNYYFDAREKSSPLQMWTWEKK